MPEVFNCIHHTFSRSCHGPHIVGGERRRVSKADRGEKGAEGREFLNGRLDRK